jgi:phosphoglucosamine mutase
VAITGIQEAGSDVVDLGVRVDHDDGWFLIRPSGMEPLIRVAPEARTASGADDLQAEATTVLREAGGNMRTQ